MVRVHKRITASSLAQQYLTLVRSFSRPTSSYDAQHWGYFISSTLINPANMGLWPWGHNLTRLFSYDSRGCSSMVELLSSKQITRVRFSSSAPWHGAQHRGYFFLPRIQATSSRLFLMPVRLTRCAARGYFSATNNTSCDFFSCNTCRHSSVGQSVVLVIPRSSVQFRVAARSEMRRLAILPL